LFEQIFFLFSGFNCICTVLIPSLIVAGRSQAADRKGDGPDNHLGSGLIDGRVAERQVAEQLVRNIVNYLFNSGEREYLAIQNHQISQYIIFYLGAITIIAACLVTPGTASQI
jgi:hypothetical protein